MHAPSVFHVFVGASSSLSVGWVSGGRSERERFPGDRKQRVTIDGKFSDWVDINAGVPQGSLLGPILFLGYINDIVDVVGSKIKIFADDTFIYRTVDQFCTTILNKDL